MYLHFAKGITPSKANKWSWNVQWIAAAPAPTLCSGGTPKGGTEWSKYGGSGLVITVSTKACAMIDRPVYVGSMGGDSMHWYTTGSSAIYNDDWKSFRTYIKYIKGLSLGEVRRSWKWHMNFVAFPAGRSKSGICAGETVPGNTNWKRLSRWAIYVDVDTSMCGFSETPVYKTSIGGLGHQWVSLGSSAIYNSGKKGFRTYIYYKGGITVAQAKAWKWHMKWVAHPSAEVVHSGSKSCAGSSSPKAWKPYGSHAVYTDVKTGCKVAEGTPRYVTALSGKSSHYTNHGVSEPYTATADGFRIWMYSTAPIYPATAAKWDWKINWIAAGTVPRTPVPTPVPSFKRAIKGGGWAVSKGKCRIDARVPGRPCLMSPNFPGKYTAEEKCTVIVGKKTSHVAFERFNTEKWFDYVQIGKVQYHGVIKPGKIVKVAHSPVITWSSDFWEEAKGWKICKARAPRLKLGLSEKKRGKKV